MTWEQYKGGSGRISIPKARINSQEQLGISAAAVPLLRDWSHVTAWFDRDSGQIMLKPANPKDDYALQVGHSAKRCYISFRGVVRQFGINGRGEYDVAAVEEGLLLTPKT